jgi:hypothetical protein
MNIDTPRTNDAAFMAIHIDGDGVPTEFARQLERELAAVTDQRYRLAVEVGQLKSRLTQTMGAVTISRNGYVEELEQQRDRLAEALIRIVKIYENPKKGCIPSSSDMYDEALQSLTTKP